MPITTPRFSNGYWIMQTGMANTNMQTTRSIITSPKEWHLLKSTWAFLLTDAYIIIISTMFYIILKTMQNHSLLELDFIVW